MPFIGNYSLSSTTRIIVDPLQFMKHLYVFKPKSNKTFGALNPHKLYKFSHNFSDTHNSWCSSKDGVVVDVTFLIEKDFVCIRFLKKECYHSRRGVKMNSWNLMLYWILISSRNLSVKQLYYIFSYSPFTDFSNFYTLDRYKALKLQHRHGNIQFLRIV